MQTNFDNITTFKKNTYGDNENPQDKQNKNIWEEETLASTEVRKYRQKEILHPFVNFPQPRLRYMQEMFWVLHLRWLTISWQASRNLIQTNQQHHNHPCANQTANAWTVSGHSNFSGDHKKNWAQLSVWELNGSNWPTIYLHETDLEARTEKWFKRK